MAAFERVTARDLPNFRIEHLKLLRHIQQDCSIVYSMNWKANHKKFNSNKNRDFHLVQLFLSISWCWAPLRSISFNRFHVHCGDRWTCVNRQRKNFFVMISNTCSKNLTNLIILLIIVRIAYSRRPCRFRFISYENCSSVSFNAVVFNEVSLRAVLLVRSLGAISECKVLK